MRDSALLLKKLKYVEAMLNIFEFSRVWKNVKSWLVYANKLFWAFNNTHMERLFLYSIQYKNSLKYKIDCFRHFSYVYTIN